MIIIVPFFSNAIPSERPSYASQHTLTHLSHPAFNLPGGWEQGRWHWLALRPLWGHSKAKRAGKKGSGDPSSLWTRIANMALFSLEQLTCNSSWMTVSKKGKSKWQARRGQGDNWGKVPWFVTRWTPNLSPPISMRERQWDHNVTGVCAPQGSSLSTIWVAARASEHGRPWSGCQWPSVCWAWQMAASFFVHLWPFSLWADTEKSLFSPLHPGTHVKPTQRTTLNNLI